MPPLVDKKKSEAKSGPIVLIGKLGTKFLGFIPKLLKLLKVGKVALAGASLAAYTLLWTWQFAVVLLFMLIAHEYGHLWMMKRFKMKTKGMYLIPFLGAAAVAEEDFPSRRAEAIIALAGPVVGLGYALVAAVLYWITGTPFFAAVASFGALLNLFNLLPITPLDGGRVLKSIALSIGTKIGITVMILGVAFGIVLAFEANFIIFVFLLPLGLMDVLWERKKIKKKKEEEARDAAIFSGGPFEEFALDTPLKVQPSMTRRGTVEAFVSYAALAVSLWAIMAVMVAEPGAQFAMKVLQD